MNKRTLSIITLVLLLTTSITYAQGGVNFLGIAGGVTFLGDLAQIIIIAMIVYEIFQIATFSGTGGGDTGAKAAGKIGEGIGGIGKWNEDRKEANKEKELVLRRLGYYDTRLETILRDGQKELHIRLQNLLDFLQSLEKERQEMEAHTSQDVVNKFHRILADGVANIRATLDTAVQIRKNVQTLWNNLRNEERITATMQSLEITNRDRIEKIRKLSENFYNLPSKQAGVNLEGQYPEIHTLLQQIRKEDNEILTLIKTHTNYLNQLRNLELEDIKLAKNLVEDANNEVKVLEEVSEYIKSMEKRYRGGKSFAHEPNVLQEIYGKIDALMQSVKRDEQYNLLIAEIEGQKQEIEKTVIDLQGKENRISGMIQTAQGRLLAETKRVQTPK